MKLLLVPKLLLGNPHEQGSSSNTKGGMRYGLRALMKNTKLQSKDIEYSYHSERSAASL